MCNWNGNKNGKTHAQQKKAKIDCSIRKQKRFLPNEKAKMFVTENKMQISGPRVINLISNLIWLFYQITLWRIVRPLTSQFVHIAISTLFLSV